MQTLSHQDIMNLPGRYRANLINTASGPRSACLIGTTNDDGQHNLAIFNTVTHIGANPPLIGLIMRPHTVERHTYENIIDTSKYTISHVHGDWVERAHQTSGKYARNISEFDVTGLHPVLDDDGTPYVQQARVSLSLHLEEEHKIASNDSILLIGRVTALRYHKEDITEGGRIDLAKANSAVVGGLYDYYTVHHRFTGSYVSVPDVKAE